MTTPSINKTVSEIIASIVVAAPQYLRPNMRLVEDLHADSLDVVEIWTTIEVELHIEITGAEWDTVKTVGDAITLATRKVKEKEHE